jgi:putative Mg2+ transporter-C (MgtC) family protein
VLATVGAAAYLVITVGFLPLGRILPSGASSSEVRVRYVDGRGVLRDVLAQVTAHGFTVSHLTTRPQPETTGGARDPSSTLVEVTLRVVGRRPATDVAMALAEIPGVDSVHSSAEVDPG